ncbi:MAG: alpha/beta hydrolase [Gammaproteobacteria bacterium]|nr:alpha/beta hydrolase [Gammaproteobacteria bacterium]
MPAENILLLPGMMCDERLWLHQIAAIDVPIHVADTSRSDNFADMAAQALAAAPPEFAMAGLSMGGILAFEIWRQASERVTHLALLDTNPHPDAPSRKSMRYEQIEEAASGNLHKLAVESLKPLYLAEKNRGDEAILATILAMALKLGPEVFERQSLALLNRPDSAATLANISCPTSVICGREDAICPVRYHEFMAREISGANLVVIDDCGHLSTMEQPEVVTEELLRLFAQ